jgi:hypothetical protein
MRVIARSLTLVLLAAAIACADAHDDVMDVLASMAGALPESNVPRFMAAISKSMPARDTLEKNVASLVNGTEVAASILPISESGDDQTYMIDLDWVLEVRSLEQDGPLTRRREVVHCELRKEKTRWKIIALQPLDFFAPK